MTTEIVKYDLDLALVKKLDETYKDFKLIPDNEDSMAMLMAGLRDYRNVRLKAVDDHKVLKAPHKDRCDFLDAKKREYLALISPGEGRLKAVQKEDKDRITAIENQRIDDIHVMIDDIKRMEYNLSDKTQLELIKIKTIVEGLRFGKDDYQEFLADAQAAAFNAINGINRAIQTRINLDREELERKAENERLEKIRAEQEEAQAKIAKAQKRVDDANREIEKKKADLDRAEWERGAKDRAEKAAKEKMEREQEEELQRLEALDAENKRLESLTPDKDKLIVLADIFDAIVPPKFKDEACEAICNDAMRGVQQISTDIRKKVEGL